MSEILKDKNIIGDSAPMQHIYKLVEKVARTDGTVLITGKSGTGKELVARSIHTQSNRRDRPFVAINCGAISPTLIESELFGYKRGAFTGANSDRDGYFKYASEGTLLLDEIAEFPLDLQVTLLRALETREITPVGGTRSIPVNTRILAATNRNLTEEVEQGRFREDLYYRLNVVEIALPALTERREDIPLLIEHFIKTLNRRFDRHVLGAEPAALAALLDYEWRGGVRELENIIERALTLCEGDHISFDCLPPAVSGRITSRGVLTLKESVARFEKTYIQRILGQTGGSKQEASRLLGIGLSSLYRKIDEHGID